MYTRTTCRQTPPSRHWSIDEMWQRWWCATKLRCKEYRTSDAWGFHHILPRGSRKLLPPVSRLWRCPSPTHGSTNEPTLPRPQGCGTHSPQLHLRWRTCPPSRSRWQHTVQHVTMIPRF
ncbi:hypothetical protein E2C01_036069 [Portunus trituberculatus]|uniref:Uncharacterized protein n=1 Tax=Portunus trituberculatus TaxID=210409 RepID=A0A5B7FA78_PORTR|nr:hypothetical protein [Portunus trituberculatus]